MNTLQVKQLQDVKHKTQLMDFVRFRLF